MIIAVYRINDKIYKTTNLKKKLKKKQNRVVKTVLIQKLKLLLNQFQNHPLQMLLILQFVILQAKIIFLLIWYHYLLKQIDMN